MKIGGTAVNKIEHWHFADSDDDDKLVESASTNPPNVYGFGHEGVLPQRARGAARRGAAGDGRARRAQVARVDPRDLRVRPKMSEVPIPLRRDETTRAIR